METFGRILIPLAIVLATALVAWAVRASIVAGKKSNEDEA